MKRLTTLGFVGILVLGVFASATGLVSAKNSKPQTQVKVFGNLAEQPDGTAAIIGAVYANRTGCLTKRRITVYDALGVARGTGITFFLNGSKGAGYFEVRPASGVGFTVGTYYARAAKKRLGHGVVCRAGRSPNTIVNP